MNRGKVHFMGSFLAFIWLFDEQKIQEGFHTTIMNGHFLYEIRSTFKPTQVECIIRRYLVCERSSLVIRLYLEGNLRLVLVVTNFIRNIRRGCEWFL
ncbi:hypothetical protein LINPERPRIM_LOCUS6304 [Linum perenne]